MKSIDEEVAEALLYALNQIEVFIPQNSNETIENWCNRHGFIPPRPTTYRFKVWYPDGIASLNWTISYPIWLS